MVKNFFSPSEVIRVTKIKYRQLAYWDKIGFIKPSYRRRGRFRLYTFGDILKLKFVHLMRISGYSVQRLRSIVRALSKTLSSVPCHLSAITILVDRNRFLVFTGEVAISGDENGYIRFSAKKLRRQIDRMFSDDRGLLSA